MASYKKKMGPILHSGLFVIQTYRQRQSDRQFLYKNYLATPYLQQFYLRFYKFLELNLI